MSRTREKKQKCRCPITKQNKSLSTMFQKNRVESYTTTTKLKSNQMIKTKMTPQREEENEDEVPERIENDFKAFGALHQTKLIIDYTKIDFII